MAHDWWKLHDKNMSWERFTNCFIDWTFSNNNIRNQIMPMLNTDDKLELPREVNSESKNQQNDFLDCNDSNNKTVEAHLPDKPLSKLTLHDSNNNDDKSNLSILKKFFQSSECQRVSSECYDSDLDADSDLSDISSNTSSSESVKKPRKKRRLSSSKPKIKKATKSPNKSKSPNKKKGTLRRRRRKRKR